jgi:hypothetical protein
MFMDLREYCGDREKYISVMGNWAGEHIWGQDGGVSSDSDHSLSRWHP